MAPPAPADGSNTVSALVATLVPVLLISGIFFVVFLVLRPKLQRNYEPRTFMLREQ
jgi:Late exocytosis, associated with Golgi transport